MDEPRILRDIDTDYFVREGIVPEYTDGMQLQSNNDMVYLTFFASDPHSVEEVLSGKGNRVRSYSINRLAMTARAFMNLADAIAQHVEKVRLSGEDASGTK